MDSEWGRGWGDRRKTRGDLALSGRCLNNVLGMDECDEPDCLCFCPKTKKENEATCRWLKAEKKPIGGPGAEPAARMWCVARVWLKLVTQISKMGVIITDDNINSNINSIINNSSNNINILISSNHKKMVRTVVSQVLKWLTHSRHPIETCFLLFS